MNVNVLFKSIRVGRRVLVWATNPNCFLDAFSRPISKGACHTTWLYRQNVNSRLVETFCLDLIMHSIDHMRRRPCNPWCAMSHTQNSKLSGWRTDPHTRIAKNIEFRMLWYIIRNLNLLCLFRFPDSMPWTIFLTASLCLNKGGEVSWEILDWDLGTGLVHNAIGLLEIVWDQLFGYSIYDNDTCFVRLYWMK